MHEKVKNMAEKQSLCTKKSAFENDLCKLHKQRIFLPEIVQNQQHLDRLN